MRASAKAFWLSAAVTAAVITPIFAAAAIYALTRVQETDNAVSGIAVLSPTSADKRTVLVMTGSGSAKTAATAAVLHFDALEGRLTCLALPINTAVRAANGGAITLSQAAASAGPSQCAVLLGDTLGISIDNYLYATPDTLCDMTQALGNAHINLSKYLPDDTLNNLRLKIDGINSQVLSPYILAEVLDSCSTSPNITSLRADGYLALLTADASLLQPALTPALKSHIGDVATDIDAQDIYIYDRIFKFFGREAPSVSQSASLAGKENADGVYELSEAAYDTAQRLIPSDNNYGQNF